MIVSFRTWCFPLYYPWLVAAISLDMTSLHYKRPHIFIPFCCMHNLVLVFPFAACTIWLAGCKWIGYRFIPSSKLHGILYIAQRQEIIRDDCTAPIYFLWLERGWLPWWLSNWNAKLWVYLWFCNFVVTSDLLYTEWWVIMKTCLASSTQFLTHTLVWY